MNKPVLDTNVNTFLFYFLLNVFSSSVIFFHEYHLLNFVGILSVISLAGIISFIISLFLGLFRNFPFLRKVLGFFITGIFIVILLVDVFLLVNFSTTFYETIFNIVGGTNFEETKGFIVTYTSYKTITALSFVLLLCVIIYQLSYKIVNVKPLVIRWFVLVALFFSFVKISLSVYSSLVYGFGGHLAAYSSLSRIGRCIYIYYKTSQETMLLIDNLRKFDIIENNKLCKKMIVIIGESYSKYHSQLYGYTKDTTPLLQSKVENDQLILYSDVITSFNDTERAIKSILSLSETPIDKYSDYPLFPYLFKKAGYYTVNIDNMDLAFDTKRIKDSKFLSETMYDFRNAYKHDFDEGVLEWLDVDEIEHPYQLFVIKLKGQHYTYKDTFPSSFEKFNGKDYEDLQLNAFQKQIVADYDNSTLYNDYVINSIIDYFAEDIAVVIYMSDHGEEVYETRDYIGHGGVPDDIKYQIEVPFMIWMSESYKLANPSIVKNIIDNKNVAYVTDDVAHTILDMAGITCAHFQSERSVASNNFAARSVRYFLSSMKYGECEKIE